MSVIRMGDDGAAQATLAHAFCEMHARGPVVGRERVERDIGPHRRGGRGRRHIGTTSLGVAVDHGVLDGELLPFEVAVRVGAEIVESVAVPVTFDLEAGRGATPADVAASVEAVIACGAVGVNIEDSIPGRPGELFATDEQAARLAAARRAADEVGIPLFLNARCDVYFGARVDASRQLDEVLERAEHYRGAGADGLFLPGLADLDTIAAVTAAVGLPLNVMVGPGSPGADELAEAGARRISQGANAFLALAGALKSLTERYLAGDLEPPLDAFGAGLAVLPALVN